MDNTETPPLVVMYEFSIPGGASLEPMALKQCEYIVEKQHGPGATLTPWPDETRLGDKSSRFAYVVNLPVAEVA